MDTFILACVHSFRFIFKFFITVSYETIQFNIPFHILQNIVLNSLGTEFSNNISKENHIRILKE